MQSSTRRTPYLPGAAALFLHAASAQADRPAERVHRAPQGRPSLEVPRHHQRALGEAGVETLYQREEARCKKDRTQNQMVR